LADILTAGFIRKLLTQWNTAMLCVISEQSAIFFRTAAKAVSRVSMDNQQAFLK